MKETACFVSGNLPVEQAGIQCAAGGSSVSIETACQMTLFIVHIAAK